MLPQILFEPAPENTSSLYVINHLEEVDSLLNQDESQWVRQQLSRENWTAVNRYGHWLYFLKNNTEHAPYQQHEKLRKAAHSVWAHAKKQQIDTLALKGEPGNLAPALEGLLLSAYTFNKYKTKPEGTALAKLFLPEQQQEIQDVINSVAGTYVARRLVNEPVVYLTAPRLSEEIKALGKEAGFSVEVLEEAKIQSLKMGGLLAVNAGSIDPPTFNILEYKHPNAKNARPLVLVGKGVVYDTGGLSIKPTAGSMDMMKSDMAGAAAVVGTIYALAKAQVPVHVIGLIPATDNRPGENAIAPGDVITHFDGTTVEVLNTDAEGRLILADALAYAKKYQPELVIDLATLTGAAARAIGPEGIVYMGTADEGTKNKLEAAGQQVYERLVEFPLWEEYQEQLKSHIADLSNLGGPNAGAITAGMFLKNFTSYPWLHLDIAGPAYLTKPNGYLTQGGSGVGVRLLFNFIKDHLAA